MNTNSTSLLCLLVIAFFLSKTKGQFISKGLFGILDSSKKRRKKIELSTMIPHGRLVFVRFLEEFEDTKETFRN